MAADRNLVDEAVSRTLRENLERITRSSEELHQAVSDIVSACASSRPTNALPAMIRAQTSAASLSAVLEVLSRLVTASLQSPVRMQAQQEMLLAMASVPSEIDESVESQPSAQPAVVPALTPAVVDAEPQPSPEHAPEPVSAPPASELPEYASPHQIEQEEQGQQEYNQAVEVVSHSEEQVEAPAQHVEPAFNLNDLPAAQQELHRRANRVAKVSMQDIKMLRPDAVNLGRENKDLCSRLRDDIEKAHKEYDRRFQPILSDPVDYFYDWMVEILAGGDSEALGEYPFPSAVLHR